MGANQFLDAEGLNAYDKALKAQLQSPESAGIEVYNPEEYTLLADSKKMSNTLFFVTPDASVEYVPPLLEDASWDLIHRLSEKGTFGKYYKVGDTKTFKVSGILAGYNYSDQTFIAIVAGINHNRELEHPGENRVHWIFSPLTSDVYVQFLTGYNNGFQIDGRPSYATVWNETTMYTAYLSKDNSNYIGKLLPDEIFNILKPVTKYAYNVRNGLTTESFTGLSTLITIPSVTELGALRGSYPWEQEKSPTYEVFEQNKFPYIVGNSTWTRTSYQFPNTQYYTALKSSASGSFSYSNSVQTELKTIVGLFFT